MRRSSKLLFTFLLLLSGNLSAAELKMDVPDLVFSDITTTVQIEAISGDLPEYVFQIHAGKRVADTVYIRQSENGAEADLRFFSGEEIQFENHTLTGKTKTAVVPLWMSVLPPLIAIFLALVFKEVIFSLVSGIFIGSAIMGFYAEGFVGIFTGFFRIIDTYILDAMNDSGHLSVIIFSILIGGIVALISKNGGMQGIVNRVSRFANSARNGQLATWGLGILIFLMTTPIPLLLEIQCVPLPID